MQNNPYIRFFSFFNLRENPFAGSPDPRYLFATRRIQEAWEAITYGIESREGIVVLTGEAGTGKTSILNRLIEQLNDRRQPVTFIFNPHLEPRHLYDFMLADFGVRPDPRWQGNPLMCLEHWLAERTGEGRTPVLIVDEAQGLPLHVLEEIRLLVNLETPQRKLLQIVLAGQPELEETLNRAEVRLLKQRIALHCRTGLLTPRETRDYIRVRLDTAGAAGKAIFSPDAVDAVHAYSGGIPRLMNLMCEHALINAYSANLRVVPARLLDEIAWEFNLDSQQHIPPLRSEVVACLVERDEKAVHPEAPLPMLHEAPAAKLLAEPLLVESESAFNAPAAADITAPEIVSVLQRTNEAVRDPAASLNKLIPVPSGEADLRRSSNQTAKSDRHVVVVKSRREQPKVRPFLTLRSELVKRSRAIRQAVQNAWASTIDERRWRQIADTIARRIPSVEQNVHRFAEAALNTKRTLYLKLRDAWPVWERAKGSLLHWLKQPLPLRYQWMTLSTAIPGKTPAMAASHSAVRRAARRARERFQVVTLSARRQGANVAVLRWLREPFHASRALPGLRATASRNSLNSAR